jgi:hypothetical protein
MLSRLAVCCAVQMCEVVERMMLDASFWLLV